MRSESALSRSTFRARPRTAARLQCWPGGEGCSKCWPLGGGGGALASQPPMGLLIECKYSFTCNARCLSLSLADESTHARTHTNARSRFVYGLHIFYWALATTTLTKPRTTATACCHNVFTSLLLSILACGKGLEGNTNTYRLGTLNRAVKQLATLRPDSICTSRFSSVSFHARFNTFATNLLMAFQPRQLTKVLAPHGGLAYSG